MEEAIRIMDFNRNFPIISIRSKSKLNLYAENLFSREGSAEWLGTDKATLGAFIKEISRRYHNNPYHNYQHAVDTTNTMSWLLSLPTFRKNLSPFHKFLLLVFALVHDVEHPGHDNDWEVKINSPWAKKYNNGSVIENHSLSVIKEILGKPEFDILAVFPEVKREEGLRFLEDMILVTDFSIHAEFLAELSGHLASEKVDFKDPVFHSLICRTLIKAADIGNTTKIFRLARHWGMRVMKEYWAQGVREKNHHLPVGPLNDPARAEFNNSQAGFIKHSALQLFELLSRVEEGVGEMLRELRKNLTFYERSARRLMSSIK